MLKLWQWLINPHPCLVKNKELVKTITNRPSYYLGIVSFFSSMLIFGFSLGLLIIILFNIHQFSWTFIISEAIDIACAVILRLYSSLLFQEAYGEINSIIDEIIRIFKKG